MKVTTKIKHLNHNWYVKFYPKFDRFHFTLSSWSYFDPRPCLHFQLSVIVFFVLAFFLPMAIGIPIFLLSLLLPFGDFYIYLPIDSGKYAECDYPQYGIYFYGHNNKLDWNQIWIRYGKKSKVIDMPWYLDWYSTSLMLKDKTWEVEKKGRKKDFWKEEWEDKKYKEVHSYTYILDSGKIQKREATVTREKREWRRKGLFGLPFFNQISDCIDVRFSDEVGERTGSWKGGCVGCGYELKKGETMLECLRRMEKERRFN